jgi:pSer/pThr/pTyr-binding forkhead associated (FHA) protein
MFARLIRRDERGRVQRIFLNPLPCTLGRGLDADVLLFDPWVSRRHCKFTQRDGVLFVEDLNSRHGTWVNGEGVSEAALYPGDELQVGATMLTVEYRMSRDRSNVPKGALSRAVEHAH